MSNFPLEIDKEKLSEMTENLKNEEFAVNDQTNDLKIEKIEAFADKRITLPPPKINESYKIQSKYNLLSIQNRVAPNLTNPIKTTILSTEEANQIGNTNQIQTTSFFDEESEQTEILKSPLNTNVPTLNIEKKTILPERKNSERDEKIVTERKISEPGILNQKQSPSTSQINNFFDDDYDHQQDYLNKSHAVATKPISHQAKILTPHREVKKIVLPQNNQNIQEIDNKNNFFDEGDDINLFSKQVTTIKTKVNIPHKKNPITVGNKLNISNVKIEKPAILNSTKNIDKPITKQVSIQDPFNFHQSNGNIYVT